MSSCLRKNSEAVVFPVFIETVEDDIDDPVHAVDMGEHNHGSGSATHLHKTALDGIGGSQLLPQVTGEAPEVEQPGQILLQATDRPRVDGLPVGFEAQELAALPLG